MGLLSNTFEQRHGKARKNIGKRDAEGFVAPLPRRNDLSRKDVPIGIPSLSSRQKQQGVLPNGLAEGQ